MPAPKFNMLSLLTKNVLNGGDPTARGVGQPLTFYWCRDTREMFLTDSVGNFINIGSLFASVLDGSLPLALPASPVKGDKGEKGDTGATGSQGLQGLQGLRGEKGEQGDLLIPTETQMGAALEALRAKQARFIAALKKRMEDNKNVSHRVPQLTRHTLNNLQIVANDAGITKEELK